MRAKVQDALDWASAQITNPTPTPPAKTWKNLCMSSARRAWGTLPWGASARIAHARVPKKYMHHTLPSMVPAGAICFGMLNTEYGHAWLAGRGALNKRIGFSTDYRRNGHIDRAPLNLPAWTHDEKVWWTAWTPFGFLPLWKDAWNIKHIPRQPVYEGRAG